MILDMRSNGVTYAKCRFHYALNDPLSDITVKMAWQPSRRRNPAAFRCFPTFWIASDILPHQPTWYLPRYLVIHLPTHLKYFHGNLETGNIRAPFPLLFTFHTSGTALARTFSLMKQTSYWFFWCCCVHKSLIFFRSLFFLLSHYYTPSLCLSPCVYHIIAYRCKRKGV